MTSWPGFCRTMRAVNCLCVRTYIYIFEGCDPTALGLSKKVAVANNWATAVGYCKAFDPDAKDRFVQYLRSSADGTALPVRAVNMSLVSMTLGTAHEDSNALSCDGDQPDNAAIDAGVAYRY